MEERIRAVDVHRYFDTTRAVDGVSLVVHGGEVYGLVGPDGAGKTTFMRLVCGALRMDSGEVHLGDFNVSEAPERAREQIGYLAQRFSLYEELTVNENLQFFASVRGLKQAQWKARSAEILDFVGLSQFRDRRAGQLSGGMKQKLGLALALVNRPRILLMDEPTTGVDPVTRQDFWKLIGPLLREDNLAVLVSTPYMDEAMRCNRIGFMRQGKLLAEGQPSELRKTLKGRIAELAGSPRDILLHTLQHDPAVEAAERFGSRLHLRLHEVATDAMLETMRASLVAAGATVDSLHVIDAQLEDVFIALSQQAETDGGDASGGPAAPTGKAAAPS